MRKNPIILSCASALVLTACVAASTGPAHSIKRGQKVFTKECSQCHGPLGEGRGSASLGLGEPVPAINTLAQANDGVFPREFVSRFVLGLEGNFDPSGAMPDFATQGLRHIYPDGGADGEVLEADFSALLDYLESIQL